MVTDERNANSTEMSGWSEENFLERLTPLMDAKDPAPGNHCPDAELLRAFAEDRVTTDEKKAIVAHLGECARCRELQARLLAFATPLIKEDELEWTNAEKRLDNWMEDVLFREQAREPSYRQIQTGVSRNSEGWNISSLWNPRWIQAACAVLTLTILAVGLWKYAPRTHKEARTARATLPAPPGTSSTGTPPPSSINPVTETPTATTPPETPNESPKSVQSAKSQSPEQPESPVANRPLTAQKATPHRSNGVVGSAPLPSSAPPEPNSEELVAANNAPTSSALPPPSPPVGAPATAGQESTTAQATNPTLVEKSRSNATQSNANLTAHGAAASSRPAGYSNHALYGIHPLTAIKPSNTSTPPVNLPQSIRLEAGTRLWIRITSLVRSQSGTLQFEGTLFEPVTQNGVATITKGTAVRGFEKQDQGSTTLAITEFGVGGVRYALKGNVVIKDTLSRGGTKALQFDAGQLMEMFVETAAVYEKSPDNTGQPGPR